ncbi:hypothetical protein G7Y89_g13273 [Cudoniella acicularis]|uniref:Zn(2)-C6 fungal-type domain-containing protein n=1 Tax=Cudoniella acicularis TaxID=354080 RepID=A0A8H4R9Y3_9HELO|nr:hypothetical protein G7Y89_g13273 [Cudoniella acicularis]
MTRKKVDPDKRKRVSQACDVCKRSKLKCDGIFPCKTCSGRKKTCSYESGENSPSRNKHKRQKTSSSDSRNSTPDEAEPKHTNTLPEHELANGVSTDSISRQGVNGGVSDSGPNQTLNGTKLTEEESKDANQKSNFQELSPLPEKKAPAGGQDEEAVVYNYTRMLQDPTGRLLEVFNRKAFIATFDKCYNDPLNVDPSWLCLLYLAFAIGLVMAAPIPGSAEDKIIQKLRSQPVDQAEVFYSNAKQLGDPTRGFEDTGFWSIQALTLMSIYMLAVSKRNAAYAYYGMAVRSAFALGLHREETMCIFAPADQSIRRNLWRSLFILDRFLAASLGRPTAIRESDCSGDTLSTVERPRPETPGGQDFINSAGLQASAHSCHVIGSVLEKLVVTALVSSTPLWKNNIYLVEIHLSSISSSPLLS